ncbi:LLM class flavin-dependent oxidoreductase [Oerskovia jenensis]|uniref:LLM class flavin-dependent oxidoreductase n=1 Tax=Oerskovia jenensis TaxID=162169 RepID=UPI0036DF3B2F
MSGTVLVAAHVDTGEADAAESLRERVVALEAAGAHLVTFAGGPGGEGLSAVEAASFAAAWTDRVGLVPVVDPVHGEPFHLSNQLSSLDRISRGRAGWWIEVVDDEAHARARSSTPVGDALGVEVAEVVQVVRLLWDSWEDGALVADQASGRFLDADRIHYVDFVGRRFSIKGPALLPRPPQGRVPVLAAAGWLDQEPADVAVLSGTLPRPGGQEQRTVVDVVVGPEPGGGDGVPASDASDAVVERVRRLGGAVTAVRLVPTGPEGARRVVQDVLPTLSAAGLVAPPPERGRTLRDLLGLARPAGVFASARGSVSSTEDESETR